MLVNTLRWEEEEEEEEEAQEESMPLPDICFTSKEEETNFGYVEFLPSCA